MKVFYDLNTLPEFRHSVLTIGSFDGVHNGHRHILEQVKQLAKQYDGESIVITFHPHPRQVIYPKDNSLRLLTTIDEKIRLLERFGIDNVVVVPFTVAFSQQSPDAYIHTFLVEKFRPRCIVVGYDHRFGLHRQGNIDYLKAAAAQGGFEVYEIPKQEVDDITVSSTKIRNALDKGAIRAANKLLGHPFTLTGKVVRGQKLGTKIGFPTANIAIAEPYKLIPPYGIYACFVHLEKERYSGMLYIGDRPSIKGIDERTIEVHIFDFNSDIYGKQIQVACVAFIRHDKTFANLELLSAALRKDGMEAKKVLQSTSSLKKKNLLR